MLHPGLGGHHLAHHAPCYRTPDLVIADVIEQAVCDCVQNAIDESDATDFVGRYVQELISEQAWQPADADQVRSRSLEILSQMSRP